MEVLTRNIWYILILIVVVQHALVMSVVIELFGLGGLTSGGANRV